MKKQLYKILILMPLFPAICFAGFSAKAANLNHRLPTQRESTRNIQVDAGEDKEICQGSTIILNGAASNYTSLLWTTSGTGTFSDPSVLNPVYFPTASEIGATEICLTAFDDSTQVTDCMFLTIVPAPDIALIDDLSACDNVSEVHLTASVTYAAYVNWSVNPNYGFIDEPYNPESATYYPSPFAIDQGSVLISITALPINPPCTQSATQTFTITFIPVPEAFAGDDVTICESDAGFPLMDAWAHNHSGIAWLTDGDGTFSDAGIQNPVYYPGAEDTAAGGVELCIRVYSLPGCSALAEECLFLSIFPDPFIDASFIIGPDCTDFDFDQSKWLPIILNPDVTGGVDFHWTTSGDGTFSNPNTEQTTYELGPVSDTWSGSVTLTLTVWGPGNCGVEAVHEFVLNVPQQIIHFSGQPTDGDDYWYGMSSYVDKAGTSVADVVEPLVQNPGSQSLTLMKDVFGYFYWPDHDPSVNVLGDWESIGYLAKIKPGECLPIYGDKPYDTTAHTYTIGPGITFLPVLTNTAVSCNTLFADHADDILLIYSWANGNVWTPGPELDPLDSLEPGQAYFLAAKANIAPFEIHFPKFELDFNRSIETKKETITKTKPDAISVKSLNFYKSHWNPIAPTVSSSVAMVYCDSIVGINSSTGQDSIGLFNTRGHCAGTIVYTHDSVPFLMQNESNLYYSLYRGFYEGEPIEMRYYQPESDREYILNYQYENFLSGSKEKQHTALFESDGFGEFSELSYRKEIQRIPVSSGWSGISSYLVPEVAGFDSIIHAIDSSVIIASSQTGIYWPDQNLNTIGDWDTHAGYIIKLSDPVELEIPGHIELDQTLALQPGWSVIPVLSTCNVSTEEVYSQIPDGLVMIKEIAGWRVFWPDLNITGLESLVRGRAYFMLVNTAVSFSFAECSKVLKAAQEVKPDDQITGWNTVKATPVSHIIGINSEKLHDNNDIKPGDIIGAFDQEGHCFGMQKITPDNAALIAYGNDKSTVTKDGFYDDEEISFRLYRTTTSETYELSVVFCMNYPEYHHRFKPNGISVIETANVAPFGISPVDINLILDVFPVPATKEIELSILLPVTDTYHFRIINTRGEIVQHHAIDPSKGYWREEVDISALSAGSYIIQLLDKNGVVKGRAAFVKTN